ncbi:hypothetical protein M2149_002953, partial [Lachnospiraceae bacterium PFB1-21]
TNKNCDDLKFALHGCHASHLYSVRGVGIGFNRIILAQV